jgi:hypothetical protein
VYLSPKLSSHISPPPWLKLPLSLEPHLPEVGPAQLRQSVAPHPIQRVQRSGGGSQPSVGRLPQPHAAVRRAVHGVVRGETDNTGVEVACLR